MKPVYVGLLMIGAAVLGGLLVKWQASQPAAAPTTAPTTASAPVAAAPAPEPPAPSLAEHSKKSSTAPRKARAGHREKPVEVAANTPPARPAVEAPATTPTPAPAAAPEPTAPAPAPAAPQEYVRPEPPPAPPLQVTLTAGTLITVRTGEGLSSDRNQPGDTFTASLDRPLVVDGYVIAERGSRLEGRVVSAQRAGRVSGLADLVVELVQLKTSDGQRVAIQTETFVKHGEASKGQDAAKIGAGAVIGAAIGAIAGGGRGAAIGAGAGTAAGAGTVMTTRGKPATLPAETRISFRLRNTITLTERRTASR